MRWRRGESSDYVEDRRGARPSFRSAGMGGGLGLIGILVVLLLSWLTGRDLSSVLNVISEGGANEAAEGTRGGVASDEAGQFATK